MDLKLIRERKRVRNKLTFMVQCSNLNTFTEAERVDQPKGKSERDWLPARVTPANQDRNCSMDVEEVVHLFVS